MMKTQTGILKEVPTVARYLSFRLSPGAGARQALDAVAALDVAGDGLVVGIGAPLVAAAGAQVEGLRSLPALVGPEVSVPSVPMAVWCWLRGDDRGEVLHRARGIVSALEAAGLAVDEVVDAFKHDGGRDLGGYIDGTENPEGDKAEAAVFVAGQGAGLDGSCFVGVQTWRHDLDTFLAMSEHQRDHVFGRRHSDNKEIADAPASAHVKRTAQEDFEPEAFVVRRSMPWSDPHGEGLVFVSFGNTLDKFEAQLRRMVGLDDGITDALFRWTRPINGAYFWCPPTRDGRLDLSALGSPA